MSGIFWGVIVFAVLGALIVCVVLYNSYTDYQSKLCGEAQLAQAQIEIENIVLQWSIQKDLFDNSYYPSYILEIWMFIQPLGK